LKRDYDDARAEKAEAVAAAAVRHALACRNEVDAFKLARDTAEDRIVDLGNRLLKAEAERVVEQKFMREFTKDGSKCRTHVANQRGTTGDRRQGERRAGYGFAPDRRKAQRRKA
jgi:hypothetical protein